MIFKNSLDLFLFFNLDSISKYNIFDKFFLLKIDNLTVFVKFDLKEKNFLTNFFHLSRIFFIWFYSKISILNFFKIFQKQSKGSSLIFFCGFTVTNCYKIFCFLDFFFNVVLYVSKNIDNLVKNESFFFNYKFHFNNINYLIGLDLNNLYNWNKEIFIIINFKNFFFKNKKFEKILIKFYEKLFL